MQGILGLTLIVIGLILLYDVIAGKSVSLVRLFSGQAASDNSNADAINGGIAGIIAGIIGSNTGIVPNTTATGNASNNTIVSPNNSNASRGGIVRV
jgi:hypothetical protein